MNCVTIVNTEIISKVSTPVVAVAEIGKWLNLSSGMIAAHTDMIQELIDSAVEAVEDYTWITLQETVYETEVIIDSWDRWFSLQRAPITAIGDVSYLNDNEWVVFDKGAMTENGLYENITERITNREWAELHFVNPPAIQSRTNAYNIKARYTSGLLNATTDNVPKGIKTAIKMIVAAYYSNRGDCVGECSIGDYPVPCTAIPLLNKHSLQRTVL